MKSMNDVRMQCPTVYRVRIRARVQTNSSNLMLAPVNVAYLLVTPQVLIAACDTFRSGAVEQLRVHCRCLDVPLFEKGHAGGRHSLAYLANRFSIFPTGY